MNHDERHRESLLLKERWSLITSGIDKRHIKIRGTKLFVKDHATSWVSLITGMEKGLDWNGMERYGIAK